jgi:hypothetical protein
LVAISVMAAGDLVSSQILQKNETIFILKRLLHLN